MKKCEARSMGLGRMEESVITLFGSTSRTRAAVKTTLRNSSIIAAKKQLTGSPPTMASVMRSIRVIRQRPAISQGADPKSLGGVARALWRLAAAVNLRRDTYASLAAFAMLFASTITSKSAAEIKQLCARMGTTDVSAAIRAPIEHHVIPDTVYGKFGVSCRAMSKMWREIKTSAGSARKPPQ